MVLLRHRWVGQCFFDKIDNSAIAKIEIEAFVVKIFATAEGKTQAILTYRGVEKKRKKPKRFLTQIPVDISVTWLDPN